MTPINQVLAITTAPVVGGGTITIERPENMQITDIGKLVSSAIQIAFIVAGILAFVFLVIGGIEWLTSGGDKGKTEIARNRITAALVGLAIVAASWAIIQLISVFFGIDILFNGGVSIPKPF